MIAKLIDWIEGSLSPSNSPQREPDLNAVTAVLYVELLRSDHVIQAEELSLLAEVLSSQFSLSSSEVADLIDNAQQHIEESADLVQFTRVVNQHCDIPSKCQLIENLWRLAYADNHLDGHEEAFIRKVADLLYVSHSDFIRSKLKVRA